MCPRLRSTLLAADPSATIGSERAEPHHQWRTPTCETPGSQMQLLASTTAFAILVTKLVDLVRNIVPDNVNKNWKWLWVLLALLLGVVIAYAFELDAFQAFE